MSENPPPPLDADGKQWLLRRARGAIDAQLTHTPMPPPANIPWSAEQLRGCFVSLHSRAGRLRGCIGTFTQDAPLWRNVEEMAIAAATSDMRFAPLLPQEMDDLVIEISALTPRQKIKPAQIEIGTHGLWIEAGPYQGVLLPQVAQSYGWDTKTFLQQTCLKAGLAADAWCRDDTSIGAFRAEVFAETSRLT